MTDTKDKAAQILTPEREPDGAEKAALECVDPQRWVLWHADDYAAGVIRLLAHAGLLRDRVREAELQDADLVMRRLADEDAAKLRREHSAALAEIDRLRATESPADDPSPVSAATEAQGTPHDPAECIPCWSRAKHQEGSQ